MSETGEAWSPKMPPPATAAQRRGGEQTRGRQASGQTGFDLTYFLYDEFTLQAPAKVGRYKFKRWIVNSSESPDFRGVN